jgi:hypothetical protein
LSAFARAALQRAAEQRDAMAKMAVESLASLVRAAGRLGLGKRPAPP